MGAGLIRIDFKVGSAKVPFVVAGKPLIIRAGDAGFCCGLRALIAVEIEYFNGMAGFSILDPGAHAVRGLLQYPPRDPPSA